MADSPYTSQTISGYNTSPPPDDGTESDANEITWAKGKDKLADPIKTLAEAINTQLVTAFAKVPNTDADQQNALGGSLAFTGTTFTIATGAITPTRTNVVLAAESGTSDTLDTMATTSVSDGGLLILSVDTGDTITINDASGAAGQIHLIDSQDLVLSGDDRLIVQRDGADWYELSRTVSSDREVVQIQYTTVETTTDGTTVIPADDTIPQNTEGDERMTLAITPTNANNILYIEAICHMAVAASAAVTAALFQDSTANALAVSSMQTGSGNLAQVRILHRMTAGTTSATTFKIRVGAASGTTTFNGVGGSGFYGGVMLSSLKITELRA